MEKPATEPARPDTPSVDFIRAIVTEDVHAGKHGGRVATRFPPEPNGYLHIGHAKSICLNFGVARDFGGICNLRFDDTNPTKEEVEYVDAIKDDVRWLGFDWDDRLYFASDYFEQLYDYAVHLIRTGKAYVDSLTADEIREHRGTLTAPGRESPYRNRSVEENLDLFARMRAGEFPDGAHVLRAKIDMASPNINMRDPVLYRIRRAHHHRTGDAWCIYPMYDFAHPPSDALEKITHSLCTLEFEDHRPLYDWLIENLPVPARPQQIEFARLNLTYTLMSKRRLLELVQEGHVGGWDDPRMPTIVGMRRRGYTAEAIRTFCDRIGVAKRENVVDVALLEHAVREDLNRRAPRVMAVVDPLRVVIENYPEDRTEEFEVANNPEDPAAGVRKVPFSRVLYIERDDFTEDPPKKYFRLAPGREAQVARRLFRHVHGIREGSAHRRDRRAPLHVRSGNARRQRAGRPEGEGHAPLGFRRARGRRRGAPLRSPVHRGSSRRRRRLSPRPESLLARDTRQREDRAERQIGASGHALPVRAHRLLLRRSRTARPIASFSIALSR